MRTFPAAFNPGVNPAQPPVTMVGIRTLVQLDADTVTHISPSLLADPEFERYWREHHQKVMQRLSNVHRLRTTMQKGWVVAALPVSGWMLWTAVQNATATLQGLLISTAVSAITFLLMRYALPLTIRTLVKRHFQKLLASNTPGIGNR